MQTIIIPRPRLREYLEDQILSKPWRILRAWVCRRQPLYLRYAPRDQYTQGALVRVGDAVIDRHHIRAADGRIYDLRDRSIDRRRGLKIVLEPAGTWRWVTVKNYDRNNPKPTKHWKPAPDGELWFNPADHDLSLLRGVYSDAPKTHDIGGLRVPMIGRYGQWRPWTMLCLRSVTEIRANRKRYLIPDPVLN